MRKKIKHLTKRSKEKYYSLSKFEKLMFLSAAIFVLIFLGLVLVSGFLGAAYPYAPAGGIVQDTSDNIWEIVGGVTRLIISGDVNISGRLNVSGGLKVMENVDIGSNLNVNGNITSRSPVKIKNGLEVINESGTSQLFINESTGNVGIGTVSPNVTLEVNGFTKLGNSESPSIKTKIFTGILSGGGVNTEITHGLDNAKILGYWGTAGDSTGALMLGRDSHAINGQSRLFIWSTTIYIIPHSTNAGSIVNKPYRVVVWYMK